MASFTQAVMRLFGFGRRQPSARPDEEQAAAAYSVAAASSALPPGNVNRTSQRIASDDALTLFRLTLRIATPSNLGFTESAARPADNVGLYARVVRSEQKVEDSYKVFSAVINTCYFLQIIVAAGGAPRPREGRRRWFDFSGNRTYLRVIDAYEEGDDDH
ncbi:f704c4bd-71de-467d-9d47-180dd35fd58c [Thermothielavioides terrestris]|uniref:F704c4bd-71de-467d-9d47-180dd35fd58c n=1 Tax=Thermothielavioides terrestris TaxID=2587410 RepID=A0A3S5CWM7_9PEZI|nr:f704c4bd-71de-467d-9d47-180dd35fd58c [Thermothielavioides terrestris]